MEEPGGDPRQSSNKAKWSEAAGQGILLVAMAWSLFALLQARWYMTTFNIRPLGPSWLAFTFLTGAVPTLLALLLAFAASWLIGAVRSRADPWRSYRDGLVVAAAFTLLMNFAMLFGQSR
jgi:hypothetical protein